MKVDMLYYREWAHGLIQQIAVFCYNKQFVMHEHTKLEECCQDADITFFIGWSEMIPETFYENRTCLVLHPSLLPFYRGGSPLQNQIIDGQITTAISVFKLDKDYLEVDSGPIYWEQPIISLEGELAEILSRIVIASTPLIESIIQAGSIGQLRFVPQVGEGFTKRRRKPEESEITIEEIQSRPALYFYNKIRALQDPYPNAFITCADGEKIYLAKAHI